jgi:hypothetical protein
LIARRSAGQEGPMSIQGVSASQSFDIASKAFHEWLQLGLNGTFNL